MKRKFLRYIAILLIASVSANTFTLGFFSKKEKFNVEKLIVNLKKTTSDTKMKLKAFASSKLGKNIISSLTLATIVYIIQYISFSLAEGDFNDADPRFKAMLDQMARDIGIRNPTNIKLKLTTKTARQKSMMRKCLELLFLVPLIEEGLKMIPGCTGPAGNIYISPTILESDDKARFILGHELSHVKHKDPLISFLSSVILNVVLGHCLGGRLGIRIALTVSKILHSQIIGKFFEVRADLTAASLGQEVAQAGIEAFKEFQAQEKRDFIRLDPFEQNKVMAEKLLFDPHPFTGLRVKYLGWYKKWKYQERSDCINS